MKEQIIKHLESVADEFEVDMSDAIDLINELDEELTSVKGDKEELQDEASDLRDDVEKLKSKIEDLEEEIGVLEEENNSLDTRFQIPEGVSDNIILSGALEDLFLNLSKIPVSEIENLVKKYSL